MTNKASIMFGLMVAVLALNGCTSQQNNVFGEEKAAPDEFAVYSRAPLSLPPDFGLRPPKPGATRPQTVMPRNDAKKALLASGGNAPANSAQTSAPVEAEQTPGIRVLLINTGADRANPNIRSLVNSETAALSGGDESLADSILFWRQSTGLKGAVIDPAVEERRMRRKKAEGDAVEEQPAPTIQRQGGGVSRNEEEKGFWGGLFD